MRLRVPVYPLVAAVALTTVAASRAPAFRAPKQANVTAACTAGQNPSITPATISMKRVDNIEWHSVSPNATSWTITPKNPKDWPFAKQSFTGTPKAPAATGQPVAAARANHPYHYKVTIQCKDGTAQVIDPDIIIATGS